MQNKLFAILWTNSSYFFPEKYLFNKNSLPMDLIFFQNTHLVFDYFKEHDQTFCANKKINWSNHFLLHWFRRIFYICNINGFTCTRATVRGCILVYSSRKNQKNQSVISMSVLCSLHSNISDLNFIHGSFFSAIKNMDQTNAIPFIHVDTMIHRKNYFKDS